MCPHVDTPFTLLGRWCLPSSSSAELPSPCFHTDPSHQLAPIGDNLHTLLGSDIHARLPCSADAPYSLSQATGLLPNPNPCISPWFRATFWLYGAVVQEKRRGICLGKGKRNVINILNITVECIWVLRVTSYRLICILFTNWTDYYRICCPETNRTETIATILCLSSKGRPH